MMSNGRSAEKPSIALICFEASEHRRHNWGRQNGGPMTEKVMTIDNMDRQRKYVAAQKQKGNGLGVVFADAFLRGMRDLGYKNPAWAMAEKIDNSIQAGADIVAVH